MSTKSSPQSPPNRTPSNTSRPARTRRRVGSRRPAPAPRSNQPPAAPSTWKERLRHYLPFVAAPSVVAALAVIALGVAVVLFTGARMAYLPATIGESWLIAHGVPASFDGVTLGLTPLLPPVLIAALVAQRVRVATRKRVSILDLGAIAALGLGVPLLVTAIAMFMVADASAVYPVAAPNVALAVLLPLGVHGLGIVAGISPQVWRALAQRFGVPAFIVDAARTGVNLLLRLLAASAVVLLILLVAGWSRMGQLIDAFPNLPASGGVALVVLSILYLPNAAVATLSVILGGSVEYAQAAASLFSVDPIALPLFPLFAAIPGGAAPWAPVLLIIPAAVIAYFFATRELDIAGILATAAWVGVLALVVTPYAGGAAGAYGYVGAHRLAFPLLALIWAAVLGGIVWVVARLRRSRTHTNEPTEQPEDDPEEEDSEEPAQEPVQSEEADQPEEEAPADPEPVSPGGSTKWVPPTDSDEREV